MKTFTFSPSRIAALLALGLATTAQAAWPDKPVTLVVPYSAGGPTDVVARVLAVPMGQSLGQTVVVENTVGAGGTIAPARVAKARNDGYTILIHHMGMATAPALYKKLPYNPLTDFEYIGQVLDVPMTLLSRKDFPANNFSELLEYVKKNQDKVSLANAGIGAVSQLCGMLFMDRIGVKLTTVPYKGAGPAMVDIMGGQIDMIFGDTSSLPHIAAGRLRGLAVTSAARLSVTPELPTLQEEGLPGMVVTTWYSLMAPAGTPPEVAERVGRELAKLLQMPAARARLKEIGVEPATDTSPQYLDRTLREDLAKWRKVISETGIKME